MTREEAISRIQRALSVPSRLQGLVLIDEESANMAIEALSDRTTDEWCSDCKEYNHEKHCCPRFNRVIREALNEVVLCKDCDR